MADEFEDWDAVETAERIASHEVSADEVVEAAIARAEAWQPRIHAIATATYETARKSAAKPAFGRFAGVPTFVKDLEDLEGVPTGFGSAALEDYVARKTATSVAQFLATGLISLGKSTTAEFGFTATTEPVHGTATRNPLNLEHSAGGSSGGAAALVAAKVVPIAHGGDGGGSIRIPAAFTGLVGLKATRGRLAPMASTKRMPVKIATYGVLTRTVRDTAAFYAAIEEEGGVSGKLPPIGDVRGPSDDKLRIGVFVDGPFGFSAHEAVRAAVDATAKLLEGMGHSVEPIAAPYTKTLADDFLLHWGFMAAGVELAMRASSKGDPSKLEPWTRGLASFMRKQWWRLPGAIWRLKRFPRAYAQAFADCDVLLSPTTGGPAPRLGHLSPELSFEAKIERIYELLPYTPVQNASGGPAISLPVATTDEGLPIAVQLAAPYGHERRLLELAYALEAG